MLYALPFHESYNFDIVQCGFIGMKYGPIVLWHECAATFSQTVFDVMLWHRG